MSGLCPWSSAGLSTGCLNRFPERMCNQIWLIYTIISIFALIEVAHVRAVEGRGAASPGRGKRSLQRIFGLKEIEEIVTFKLRTRENPKEPEVLTPGNSSALLTRRISMPFKIITHGFLEAGSDKAWIDLAQKFLNESDVNVITVDWGRLAKFPAYFSVARRCEEVGSYLGSLLLYLFELGADPAALHIVGFSLGAHIAGYTSLAITPHRIARITGLDPALTSFRVTSENRALNKTDAEFVDVVHTNGGVFGFLDPLGHADFYMNGGRRQPACSVLDIGTCAHMMALYYFTESIDPKSRFPSDLCEGIPEDKSNRSRCYPTNYNMGLYLDPSARGIFLTETRSKEPYSPVRS